MQKPTKIYFPNLNGLRFIAACCVIINHVEQFDDYYSIGSLTITAFAKNVGKQGVMMFFVLSGFLITYLLLSEEKTNAKIYTKQFYIRRFLRIVPLYLLLVILTFFVFEPSSFWQIPNYKSPVTNHFSLTLILHLCFLSNLVTAMFGFLPYIAPAWSIGTEEQAYFLWPILLKKFKKNRDKLMLGIIIVYFLFRVLFRFLDIPYREIFYRFWVHFNIDSIAIGGLIAVLLFKKSRLLKYLVNIKVFWITLILTLILVVFGVKVPHFQYIFYSVLFAILILNLASNEKLKNTLEWNPINYLGKISYGIYMYHFVVMILVFKFASAYDLDSSWIIYPLILIGTIIISSLSYHYFEAFFLRKKRKYSLVISGEK